MNTNIQKFSEHHNKLLKKYGVTMKFSLETTRKKMPWLATLAIKVLNHYKFYIKAVVIPN